MFNYLSVNNMRRFCVAAALCVAALTPSLAQTYSLEDCRRLALRNNKEVMTRRENLKKAEYTRKEARAAYFPALDFAGGYIYNQKDISIFDSDQLLPVKNFDLRTQSYEFSVVKNPMTGEPIKGPNGEYIPEQVAYLPKEAMTYNIHNVFFGAVTLTQPVFMGGKIVALNKMASLGEEIADNLYANEEQNVIYSVDAAYWTVVSLKAKKLLAESYIQLLDTLLYDVDCMERQGVATRADRLNVEVKRNQANVDLTKVDNGLVLSRMALAQVCGLPVNSDMQVADESTLEADPHAEVATSYDMENVYAARPDLRALTLATKVEEQKANVARASMMPQIALMADYMFTNPNLFDGYKRRFNGQFQVGVMVKIPIWHWGGNYYGYKAARSSAVISQLALQDAREKINLQVSQAAFRADEALKTYNMCRSNIAAADENLRCATVGFHEGVMTVTDVMAAQTAWLKAHSENVDAIVDVQLCDVYLNKVLGRLSVAR